MSGFFTSRFFSFFWLHGSLACTCLKLFLLFHNFFLVGGGVVVKRKREERMRWCNKSKQSLCLTWIKPAFFSQPFLWRQMCCLVIRDNSPLCIAKMCLICKHWHYFSCWSVPLLIVAGCWGQEYELSSQQYAWCLSCWHRRYCLCEKSEVKYLNNTSMNGKTQRDMTWELN